MKKMIFALITLIPLSAFAAPPSAQELQDWVRKTLNVCPGATLSVEPLEATGPSHFSIYKVVQTSSDQYCGATMYALRSTATGQVVVGTIISLGKDDSPVENRIASRMSKMMMNSEVKVVIDPRSLDDGLRTVHIQEIRPEGPLPFTAWLDESGDYLLIGRRGSIADDPRQELLREIGLDHAVVRGAKDAPIHIVELSDLQCPMCKHAHEALEPIFQKNQDRINWARLDLPLISAHDWTLAATLGARAIARVSPPHYWEYVSYIFENQEKINVQVIEPVIRDFCEMHQIPWSKVEPIYRSESEKKAVLEQVGRAFGNGIFATPTFIVNGQMVYFGGDGQNMTDYLGQLLKASTASPGKPAAKKSSR